MEVPDTDSEKTGEEKSIIPFKKPILIGKIGRLPKKICSQNTSQENKSLKVVPDKPSEVPQIIEKDTVPTEKSKSSVENEVPLAYNEPSWSGLPKSNGKDYIFEVLKNGSIIETVNLMSRPFWVFGRLAGCNICMQHPTISRYHAVLQYRDEGSSSEPAGFYIYDLGSTHGTFLNKNRLKPKLYTRIQVGHMLKLGCSTRSYILNGPEYDEEEESELSVTELKQKRVEEMRKFEEEKLRREQEIEEKKRKEEERGIDWGIGEDADEETDLSENPFARTTNEDLYLDDPKKALRGFFEREGLDLEYDCNEHGMGQFLCKVELPVDDELGRPIVAEVLHKGKKKEAVVQCALEACRILDRFGVLRQATHESRKRKVKNWEENDYYDSDDDTFLDRTGTIEKKREKRMQAKLPGKAETYETLLEKEKSIASSIAEIERQLNAVQYKNKDMSSQPNEEDSLETFMKELKDSKPDKQTVSKLKLEITRLKIEHANVIRLVNIAKPASLPPLVAQYSPMPSTSKDGKSNILPIIGKRKKIKLQLPIKLATEVSYEINDMDDEEDDEEEKSSEKNEADTEYRKEKYPVDEKVGNENEETNESLQEVDGNLPKSTEDSVPNLNASNEISPDPAEASYIESMSSSSDDEMGNVMEFTTIKSLHNTMTFKKFENILRKGLPPFADKYQEKLEKILNKLKKLATNEDRMHVDWKMLAAKKRKVMKLISDLKHCEPNERLEHKVSSELNRILTELNSMTEQKYKVIDKVKKMGDEIKNISHAINKDFRDYQKEIEAKSASEQSQDTAESGTDEDRKKKKNQRRIQQRQERAQMERQRGYEEDAGREDYSMWLPPTNQTGDGRTNLNDKYGY